MSGYKINGRSVNETGWISFKMFLLGEFPSVEEIFKDGVVTKEEIVRMLDADEDGNLTYKDFKNVNSTQFSGLDAMRFT